MNCHISFHLSSTKKARRFFEALPYIRDVAGTYSMHPKSASQINNLAFIVSKELSESGASFLVSKRALIVKDWIPAPVLPSL